LVSWVDIAMPWTAPRSRSNASSVAVLPSWKKYLEAELGTSVDIGQLSRE
jgi:hypothetical protein